MRLPMNTFPRNRLPVRNDVRAAHVAERCLVMRIFESFATIVCQNLSF